MKKKLKHITFDLSWFHLRIKTSKDAFEELCEFFYLMYKTFGVVLGLFIVAFQHLLWFWITLLFVWLMFDVRMQKGEKRK